MTQIEKKQEEIIEHLKAYYDAQNSPAVKLIEPQWGNYLKQLESELASLKQNNLLTTKESLKITDEEIEEEEYHEIHDDIIEEKRNGGIE